MEFIHPPPISNKRIGFPAQLLVPAMNFLEYSAIALEQKLFYYYFDLRNKGTWNGTVLTKRKNLTTPQNMRDLRNVWVHIPDGGYHFSYMGGVDRVIDKMTSIVDGNELVVKSGGKFIERNHIKKCINQGEWVFEGAGGTREIFSYDVHNIRLPNLDEFLRKYPYFLREPEKYFNA